MKGIMIWSEGMVEITAEIFIKTLRAVAFSSLLVIIADPGTRRAGMEDFFVRTLKSFQNVFGSVS